MTHEEVMICEEALVEHKRKKGAKRNEYLENEQENKEKNDYSVYNLSEEDFQKLVDACKNTRDKVIVLLMGRLALRAHEVANVKIKNIDFSNGYIILDVYKGYKAKHGYSKTKEELTIPMPKEIRDKIEFLSEKLRDRPDAYIIHNVDKEYGRKPMSVAQIENIIGDAGDKAGIKNPIPPKVVQRIRNGIAQEYTLYERINSHLLRHTAGRHILKVFPGDYRLAQKILRHAKIDTTIGLYGQESLEEKTKKMRQV
jgi:integrase